MKIETHTTKVNYRFKHALGSWTKACMNSRVIQDSIIKGALRFINQLPMAVFGSLDQDDHVWASVFIGTPGFMQAEDDRIPSPSTSPE